MQLQVQTVQISTAQMAHTDALKILGESTQLENFHHIFGSVPFFV